jgi:Transposase DDE domain group 1
VIPRSPPTRFVFSFTHSLTNLGNFLRTLATPEPIKDWSLTTLKEKLIKIGAKVVSHGRYVAFQMAEVAIPGNLFADILRMIAELRAAARCIDSVMRSVSRIPSKNQGKGAS